MSTFTTVQLANERVLVKGTDNFGVEGQEVLSSGEWLAVQAQLAQRDANGEFDAAVEEVFGPIFEAIEKIEAAGSRPAPDESAYVVLQDGEEATPGSARVVHHLGRDAQILRLLDEGKGDRLVWVNDTLEVLAQDSTPGTAGTPVGPSPDVTAPGSYEG